MKTKFALEELTVQLLNGSKKTFWFDGNSKITGEQGSFEKPVANAFSLVQIKDCPFATEICKSICYIHGLEKAEKAVHDKYYHNRQVIREILGVPDQGLVETAFVEWVRSNCQLVGLRWHVSGDIFSMEYAQFIANVCNKMPEVFSWIYTRSFIYLEPLLEAKNLVVNLSADKDNWPQALEAHRRFKFRLCYLTMDGKFPELPDGSVIFPSYELRGRDLPKPTDAPWWKSLELRNKKMVCPPDFFGQNEQRRCGPCEKCLTK